jgi:hypothetical protein
MSSPKAECEFLMNAFPDKTGIIEVQITMPK